MNTQQHITHALDAMRHGIHVLESRIEQHKQDWSAAILAGNYPEASAAADGFHKDQRGWIVMARAAFDLERSLALNHQPITT